MQELIDEIIKKLIKEIKGPTRVDLLIALKDLFYVIVEYQRKERVLN